MPELNINAALAFLDMLDQGGRHTIASEAPFGGTDGGPKWEGGATYEPHQRELLIADIKRRQARGSNVYYGVNHPCPVGQQQGFKGKCNVEDIIAIRALAFDMDLFQDISLIENGLNSALRPSLIINTGGGLHLIYLFKEPIAVKLYRPPQNDEQKRTNEFLNSHRSKVQQLANDFETMLRAKFPKLKIDGMSNIDRVMRLPGTVNFPKAEKREKGQIEALAHVAKDYQRKFTFSELRSLISSTGSAPLMTERKPYIPRPNAKWTPYKKAKACCQYLCDIGAADSNDWYVKNVMLPLIGAIHDESEYNRLTVDEALECFMLAISGGARYGTMGRGQRYFARQWTSHHPERPNYHRMTLGTLIRACKLLGMRAEDTVAWKEDYQRQERELKELNQTAPPDVVDELRRYRNDR